MIFTSRTRRDLNHDPMPYLDAGGWRSSSGHVGVKVYNPRAKFDHVQHNPPNPILVEFREDCALNPTIPVTHMALIWVTRDLLQDLFAFEVQGVTLAFAQHATRALTRLAALTKEQA